MISAEVNVPSRAPRYMAALLAVLACIGAPAAHAEEEMLRVYMDHARVLKLDRPVSKVIIGNAEVADARLPIPTRSCSRAAASAPPTSFF